MNKFFIALLMVVGLVLAQTYNNSTDLNRTVPKVLEDGFVNEFILDVTLDSGETGLSRWFDIGRLPLLAVENQTLIKHINADSVNLDTVTTTIGLDLDGGDLMYSCYDVEDSAAIHDTVYVYAYTEQSDYAGNGQNPSSAKSDLLDTLHTDSCYGQSNTQIMVETTRNLTFDDESARYVRWRFVNNQSIAQSKNDIRCRAYWTRKPRAR